MCLEDKINTMTHDEIVELIREVVQAERKAISWFQRLREAATLVIPLVAVLGFLNLVFIKVSVEPAIDQKVQAHSMEARKQMTEVGARYVTREEWEAIVVGQDLRWKEQDRSNVRVETTLLEIQRDIKELLRRK